MLVCYWYVRITIIYVKQYADSVDLVGIKLLYCPCWYVPTVLKSPPCRNKKFLRYKIWDYLLTLKREILLVWPSNWGPSYRNSYAICISTNGLAILMCLIFRAHLASMNNKLAKEESEQGKKGFRYLL